MAGAYHHEQFRIAVNDLLTLARGACVHWAPKGTNSKLVSMTCRLLAKAQVGKLIWATSDTDAGEIGTIYQACGWVYVGTSDGVTRSDMEIVSPNGRVYNRRSIGGWAKQRRLTLAQMQDALLDNGWHWQPGNPKHRYVCVLDKSDRALMDRIEHMRQPYPKRAGLVQVEEQPGPPADGGSIPTSPLHESAPILANRDV